MSIETQLDFNATGDKSPGRADPAALYSNALELHVNDNNVPHRLDGPAVVFARADPAVEGSEDCYLYYKDGLLHRTDGPARAEEPGYLEYWENGLLHRDWGPAVIGGEGYFSYYQHGQLHREEGPAVITERGQLEWYQFHQLHRLDGPAVITELGQTEWWVFGKQYHTAEECTVAAKMTKEDAITFTAEFGRLFTTTK